MADCHHARQRSGARGLGAQGLGDHQREGRQGRLTRRGRHDRARREGREDRVHPQGRDKELFAILYAFRPRKRARPGWTIRSCSWANPRTRCVEAALRQVHRDRVAPRLRGPRGMGIGKLQGARSSGPGSRRCSARVRSGSGWRDLGSAADLHDAAHHAAAGVRAASRSVADPHRRTLRGRPAANACAGPPVVDFVARLSSASYSIAVRPECDYSVGSSSAHWTPRARAGAGADDQPEGALSGAHRGPPRARRSSFARCAHAARVDRCRPRIAKVARERGTGVGARSASAAPAWLPAFLQVPWPFPPLVRRERRRTPRSPGTIPPAPPPPFPGPHPARAAAARSPAPSRPRRRRLARPPRRWCRPWFGAGHARSVHRDCPYAPGEQSGIRTDVERRDES